MDVAFNVGDKAVYPAHGVAEVIGIEKKEINTTVCSFYVLKVLATGMQILVPKDKALAAVLRTIHVTLNFELFTLLCVHVAAALKHHFGDRDAVLARMLPIVKPKE